VISHDPDDVSLPSSVETFLRDYGFSDDQIEACDLGTRLMHDLGVDGDSLIDLFILLEEKYGVDMHRTRLSFRGPLISIR
jgi:hypothetical protein